MASPLAPTCGDSDSFTANNSLTVTATHLQPPSNHATSTKGSAKAPIEIPGTAPSLPLSAKRLIDPTKKGLNQSKGPYGSIVRQPLPGYRDVLVNQDELPDAPSPATSNAIKVTPEQIRKFSGGRKSPPSEDRTPSSKANS